MLAPYALKWRIYWLTSASFIFYAWWNPPFLALLIGSILVNYAIGRMLTHKNGKAFLWLGIAFNLAVIGYYKYFWFFLSQILTLDQIEQNFSLASPLLPLGISFFTFQQIAYLVDRYQGKVVKHNLREYTLFVSFFPQLIAGPIVHQKEILPQLTPKKISLHSKSIAIGLACFIMGLSKKTLLADPLGTVASPLFVQSTNTALTFAESWLAALSYTLQLYFDFSGYSDMAIGLGLMFGIKLPLNFFSPYKATNIIDFWRRWHITLSRFLRDYLYIPLGGNQKGRARRYINLMLTMLLGGLWHGAGWTFIIWGGMHGLYLCINHAWLKTGLKMPKILAWALTFTAVTFAWVLFRATSLDSALSIWASMLSPAASALSFNLSFDLISGFVMVGVGLFIALFMPTIHQWLRGEWSFSSLPLIGRWKPTALQAFGFAGLLWTCLIAIQFIQSEFLYFNF